LFIDHQSNITSPEKIPVSLLTMTTSTRARGAGSPDRHLRKLRLPQLFPCSAPGPQRQQTSASSPLSCLSIFPSFAFEMRVNTVVRAQSLASNCLRSSARSASRISPRCALSTVAASRTPYTNGTKTDTWICNQATQGQRRWNSVAAQVYVLHLAMLATWGN
jgi:hypothetical protein